MQQFISYLILISDKENHAYIIMFQYNLIVLLEYLHTAALLHSVIINFCCYTSRCKL